MSNYVQFSPTGRVYATINQSFQYHIIEVSYKLEKGFVHFKFEINAVKGLDKVTVDEYHCKIHCLNIVNQTIDYSDYIDHFPTIYQQECTRLLKGFIGQYCRNTVPGRYLLWRNLLINALVYG